MWLKPKTGAIFEPIELRDLKLKLANLSCKCIKDKKSDNTDLDEDSSTSTTDHILKELKNDIGVQAEHKTADQHTSCRDPNDSILSLNKDHLCPGCFVTMNLLRQAPYRILKDEESETKTELFACDKGTGNPVKSVGRTTSITTKLGDKYSNLSLCDYNSECSSEYLLRGHDVKRNHNVKFVDVKVNTPSEHTAFTGACFCLENFMDTIRPPIFDNFN